MIDRNMWIAQALAAGGGGAHPRGGPAGMRRPSSSQQDLADMRKMIMADRAQMGREALAADVALQRSAMDANTRMGVAGIDAATRRNLANLASQTELAGIDRRGALAESLAKGDRRHQRGMADLQAALSRELQGNELGQEAALAADRNQLSRDLLGQELAGRMDLAGLDADTKRELAQMQIAGALAQGDQEIQGRVLEQILGGQIAEGLAEGRFGHESGMQQRQIEAAQQALASGQQHEMGMYGMQSRDVNQRLMAELANRMGIATMQDTTRRGLGEAELAARDKIATGDRQSRTALGLLGLLQSGRDTALREKGATERAKLGYDATTQAAKTQADALSDVRKSEADYNRWRSAVISEQLGKKLPPLAEAIDSGRITPEQAQVLFPQEYRQMVNPVPSPIGGTPRMTQQEAVMTQIGTGERLGPLFQVQNANEVAGIDLLSEALRRSGTASELDESAITDVFRNVLARGRTDPRIC